MLDVSVVELEVSDIPDWERLERSCFAQPWSAAQLESGLTQGSLAGLGAKRGGVLLGYVAYYLICESLEILNIAVTPAERGHGIGARLLEAVLAQAEAHGATRAVLEVSAGNQAALALYSRFGFAEIGRRPGYYPESGEDAILMVRDFGIEESRD